MLRVLHIGKYYPPFHGGIENFLCDLAECQLEQGDVKPSVLVHQHEAGRAEATETINNVFVRRTRILGKAAFTPLAPTFLKSVNRTIDERNPDILHLHLPNPSVFWCLFSRSARKLPWIIHWHSDVLGAHATSKVRALYPFYRLFEKATLVKAKKIICTSPPYLETSLALRAFKQKCQVVPLGARDNNPKLQSVIADQENQETGLGIICVGRLTYYKGHQYLLEAILDQPNIRLDIVGSGELETNIAIYIQKHHLNDRVKIHTNAKKKDLLSLTRSADILCLPSIERTEAFGLAIIEAAALSKPALVSNLRGSGMSWVVRHGENGWTFDEASSSDLARMIIYLLKNKHLLRKAGIEARSRFLQEFLIENIADKVLRVYHQN